MLYYFFLLCHYILLCSISFYIDHFILLYSMLFCLALRHFMLSYDFLYCSEPLNNVVGHIVLSWAIQYCSVSSYFALCYIFLSSVIVYRTVSFAVALCNCSLFCDIIIVAALNKAVLDMAITFQNYCFTSYIVFLAQFYWGSCNALIQVIVFGEWGQ